MIIGIDHGYYAIKTRHCSFPAGLTCYGSHEPYTRQSVLEVDGQFYVCGTGRQPVRCDKTENDTYYLLTLAALAQEIKMRGAPNESSVKIAAGLPLTSFGRDKPKFRQYLLRSQPVLFRFEGTEYKIAVEDVALFPQGYAALLTDPDLLLDEPSLDLRLKDVRLTHPPMVILTGKGRKVRQVPLMKDTCKLLDRYIRSFHSDSQSQMIPLFYNAKKQALSRYGVTYILKKYAAKASPVLEPQNISPHVLRHTKAMHLLRAGVNMIYIRDFLGHADISTTEVYARIDAEMKRKVFEEKVPNYTPNTTMPWEEDEDLLQWLTQFGKKTF